MKNILLLKNSQLKSHLQLVFFSSCNSTCNNNKNYVTTIPTADKKFQIQHKLSRWQTPHNCNNLSCNLAPYLQVATIMNNKKTAIYALSNNLIGDRTGRPSGSWFNGRHIANQRRPNCTRFWRIARFWRVGTTGIQDDSFDAWQTESPESNNMRPRGHALTSKNPSLHENSLLSRNSRQKEHPRSPHVRPHGPRCRPHAPHKFNLCWLYALQIESMWQNLGPCPTIWRAPAFSAYTPMPSDWWR
jgi:hypothetical protein